MAEATPAPAKLRVDRISKSFRLQSGNKSPGALLSVLNRVSFDVQDHEFVSIIGESGCGKSTLLRIIQGLLRPDGGSLQVNGTTVRGPGYDRGIVFQQPSLLPWRSARKNIEFGLELKGVPVRERLERANKYLALVGLQGFENNFPHQLSGGMQQRVGLARALAIDPEILLMDEPFSALDAQTRELMQAELTRIYHETRKTITFVTHDLDEAVYLSDRVIVMSARPGQIKEIVKVPFGRPRSEVSALRGTPEFLELRTYIWHSIRPAANGS